MPALIFTHPPDYLSASHTVRSLLACGVEPILAIHESDPLLRIEGARVIRTRAPRGGNLNGKPFILESLRLMEEHADGTHVLKVDSDSLVFRLDWLAGKEETGIGLHHAEHRAFYGFCYALRADRLPEMIRAAERLHDGLPHPEDIAIGTLADTCGGLYRYENLTPENRLGAYKWTTARPAAWWRTRYDALCFQRGHGIDRRNVSDKMAELMEVNNEQ